MPGMNLPWNQVSYYLITLIVSGTFHEIGHAIAAVRYVIHLLLKILKPIRTLVDKVFNEGAWLGTLLLGCIILKRVHPRMVRQTSETKNDNISLKNWNNRVVKRIPRFQFLLQGKRAGVEFRYVHPVSLPWSICGVAYWPAGHHHTITKASHLLCWCMAQLCLGVILIFTDYLVTDVVIAVLYNGQWCVDHPCFTGDLYIISFVYLWSVSLKLSKLLTDRSRGWPEGSLSFATTFQ